MKKLTKITIIVVAVIFIAGCFIELKDTTVINDTQYFEAKDTLKLKIRELKDNILDRLKSCESSEAKESDALIIFDSNRVPSIGNYMFQRLTVIGYYKKLYNRDITMLEATLIALDEKKARQLADDIIFEKNPENKVNEFAGINNWENCKYKIGLEEDIRWINKISK